MRADSRAKRARGTTGQLVLAAWAAVFATGAFACGPGGGDPGMDGSAADAPVERRDPPPPPALRCGTATCAANQVCVFPCNTAAVRCFTRTDGGTCPDGWTEGVCPPDTSPNGCLSPQPAPLDPFCFDLPAACGGTAACGCLPYATCQMHGTCSAVSGRDVQCGC